MAINLGSTIIDLIDEINSKGSVAIDSIDGLKGGTLTSPITFKGGDAATASKAILDQNNQGQVTDTSTATLLGFNSAKEFLVGSNSYKTVIRGNSNSTICGKNIGNLALKSDIPAKVEETLVGYLMDDTVNQVIYWDADNEEFTSRDVTELETKVVGNATPTSEPITLNILQIEDKFYKIPSNYVKLTGDQTIDGVKIFKAPADVSGTDVATTKFKTSNGGVIIIGKEGANSGVMLRFDQTEGTCRLRFRGSATAGAMVWEQPEKAAKLYFDMGNDAGTGKNRVALRNKAGTLALTSELPSAVSANPTLSGSETELTGLKIGNTNYKIPSGGSGGSASAYLHSLTLRCTKTGDNDNWYDMVLGVYSTKSEKITLSNIANYKFSNLMFACSKTGKTTFLVTDMFVGYIGMLSGTMVTGYNAIDKTSFMFTISSVYSDTVNTI